MIVREFNVWTLRNRETKKISKFMVDDSISGEDDRPAVAEFIVSQCYPEDVQRARAREYSTYMNRIVKATKNAYSENLLADKLKWTV